MRIIRTLGITGVTTLAALATAVGTAPAAHADGCVDDYLAGGSYYVFPQEQSVKVSGGVVTVDTNQVVPDATRYAGFGAGVTLNETGKVVVLVNCVK
jgi:hypothetical protein